MAQCAENIAASCNMRHPLLPVPRAYHVGPDLGLAGGTSSSPWRPTSMTSRATWSAGTTRSTGSHREAHPADSGPARRGPVRVLTRTRPRQFSLSRGAGAGQNSGSQPAGGTRTPAWRPEGVPGWSAAWTASGSTPWPRSPRPSACTAPGRGTTGGPFRESFRTTRSMTAVRSRSRCGSRPGPVPVPRSRPAEPGP